MKTKFFTLILALTACAGTMLARDYERVQIDDLYYNLDSTSKTAEIAGYSKNSDDYNDYVITNIAPTIIYKDIVYTVKSIGDHAFADCSSLISLKIPKSVTSIGFRAFAECESLESVEIPNSVTSIRNDAFKNCSSLTSIKIPKSVTSIGDEAFYGCSFTSIKIPNSVTSIGFRAFAECPYLESIKIPNSVTSIGNGAFAGCRSLTSIYYNGTLEEWCNHDFSELMKSWRGGNLYIAGKKVTNLVIPNSVTSIGNGAFYNCESLTSVTIPNSVANIGKYAFAGCWSLTSVTIPNSVTSIGDGAFADCENLTSIYYNGTLEEWCNHDFSELMKSWDGEIFI